MKQVQKGSLQLYMFLVCFGYTEVTVLEIKPGMCI